METQLDDLQTILNNLLAKNKNAVAGYTSAAEYIDGTNYKNYF
ncbi:PA2169 family four-helix-bundle protein [Flavobacteriaceae bacterium]|nr:PA2169 family four-helix-bundle protein [Flavobacteriaceae bacterium]